MYIISNPKDVILHHGSLWNKKNDKPLIKFIKGEAKTSDKVIAEQLEKQGFIVEEIKEPETPKKIKG